MTQAATSSGRPSSRLYGKCSVGEITEKESSGKFGGTGIAGRDKVVLLLRHLALIVIFSLCGSGFALDAYPDAKWVESDFADGDSFPVEFAKDGKIERHVVRLYFVDCAETVAESDSDRRRVLEQMRYFGLKNPDEVLQIGEAAREFVRAQLQAPFTVSTVFASALGRSKQARVYAQIRTASGEDLAALLIQKGLARVHGVGRATADGVSAADNEAHLSDMQASAMMRREGVWKQSDPTRLIELREIERAENREFNAQFEKSGLGPVDINTASKRELETIPGIGPVLADRIIQGRPYRSVDELRRIKGFSDGKMTDLAEHVQVGPSPETRK